MLVLHTERCRCYCCCRQQDGRSFFQQLQRPWHIIVVNILFRFMFDSGVVLVTQESSICDISDCCVVAEIFARSNHEYTHL